jgi:hypothetical protein
MSWADENVYEPTQSDRAQSLEFREYTWQTKKREFISIKNMDDLHLLNALKLCRDSVMQDAMLKEMTFRLFEERVKKMREL